MDEFLACIQRNPEDAFRVGMLFGDRHRVDPTVLLGAYDTELTGHIGRAIEGGVVTGALMRGIAQYMTTKRVGEILGEFEDVQVFHFLWWVMSVGTRDFAVNVVRSLPGKTIYGIGTCHDDGGLYIIIRLIRDAGRGESFFSGIRSLEFGNRDGAGRLLATAALVEHVIIPRIYTGNMYRSGRLRDFLEYRQFWHILFRVHVPTASDVVEIGEIVRRCRHPRYILSLAGAADEMLGTHFVTVAMADYIFSATNLRTVMRCHGRAVAYILSRVCRTSQENVILFMLRAERAVQHEPSADFSEFLDGLDDFGVFAFPNEVVVKGERMLVHYATTYNGVKIVRRVIDTISEGITSETHALTSNGYIAKVRVFE